VNARQWLHLIAWQLGDIPPPGHVPNLVAHGQASIPRLDYLAHRGAFQRLADDEGVDIGLHATHAPAHVGVNR